VDPATRRCLTRGMNLDPVLISAAVDLALG